MSDQAIKAQGAKTYEAMRARMPAEERAAERSTAEVTRLVKDLTGDATPLFVPPVVQALASLPVAARPMTADVENDGDRGPRVSDEQRARSAFAAQMQAFASSAPVEDLKVLGAIVRELPGLRLLATCEAFTASGLRGHGDDSGMPATTLRETAVADFLGVWRLFQRLELPAKVEPGEKQREWPASHLPRRTIGDYIHGRVALPAKDGAR